MMMMDDAIMELYMRGEISKRDSTGICAGPAEYEAQAAVKRRALRASDTDAPARRAKGMRHIHIRGERNG